MTNMRADEWLTKRIADEWRSFNRNKQAHHLVDSSGKQQRLPQP